MTDVLVIEDEALSREFVETCLGAKGLDVRSCASGAEAWRILDSEDYRLVIADLELPGVDAMEILRKVRSTNPDTDVLVVTGHNSVENAVECITQGAFDFLLKPVSRPRLEALVDRVLERQELIAEAKTLRRRAAATSTDGDIVCKSKQMQTVLELVRAAADTDSTVLIRGESGTGKELVARFIHNASPRVEGSYVAINCGALPENMIESELFGHEKGAFTGAQSRKPGLLEIAHQGTLFLDEIGDMPLPLQAKLLRAIETGAFYRLGGIREQKVDVRFLSATNKELKEEIRQGTFREDLFFRISALTVHIPPLRERTEDIVPLIEHIRGRSPAFKRKRFSDVSLKVLINYGWPGNVRELQNVVHHQLLLSDSDIIEPGDLPRELTEMRIAVGSSTRLADLEREHILRMLEQTGGNRSRAAEALGIHPRTLARKLTEYGVE